MAEWDRLAAGIAVPVAASRLKHMTGSLLYAYQWDPW